MVDRLTGSSGHSQLGVVVGKTQKLSEVTSISQWQMVINHDGRDSVVLCVYNLNNKIPASIVRVSCGLGVILGSVNELSRGSLSRTRIYW